MVNEQALRRALAIGEHHLPAEVMGPAREALDRLDERARLEPERTVVALIGATGSGKSSLVNAIAGQEIARVAAIRPTTSRALALVSGGGAEALLDWLEIGERAEVPGEEGLILLDLPDVDSVIVAHKATTQRLADAVDVLVWVLDPEKYADAVLHKEFIEPFATHGEVAFAVVNQSDRLREEDLRAVVADATALFRSYGLPGDVLVTSARTGEGVDALRERLLQIARQRSARAARATADVARAARTLRQAAQGSHATGSVSSEPIVAASARAAGVGIVARAVQGSTIRAGRASVGWPVTRWLARFRPDPLKRLHLDREAPSELVRTSLPGAPPIQESAVRSEAYRVVDGATAALPQAWRATVNAAMDERVDHTLAGFDRAIAGVELTAPGPRWWTAARWLHWLLLGCAIVGAVWLAGLAMLGYLALPEPGLPMLGPIPWPTALLLGGVLGGVGLGILAMVAVRARARRVSQRAVARLTAAIAGVVNERFTTPLGRELSEWNEFRSALAEASD